MNITRATHILICAVWGAGLLVTACGLKKGDSRAEGPSPFATSAPEVPAPNSNGFLPLAPKGPYMAIRDAHCPPAKSSDVLPLLVENQNPVVPTQKTDELQAQLHAACASCHGAPTANKGGFSYLSDSLTGKELAANGEVKFYPGMNDAATQLAAALSSGRMPPKNIRDQSPQAYEDLARRLKDWIDAGKPSDSFPVSEQLNSAHPISTLATFGQATDIGDCIPDAESVGHDPDLDSYFEKLEVLPLNLTDTDIKSLDTYALARLGTVYYNVEYPLWADNAEKGRMVHFPSHKRPDGTLVREPATYDAATLSFKFPENTRFYKTFYKAVTLVDGTQVYRKVETRIIVVRNPPRAPLMGSYRWNDSETQAELITTPYRDGTGFKDSIFALETNLSSHAKRTYAIPGSQRCIECHKGTDSYILGFTPLQLNRRRFGEAGRDLPVAEDELTQVNRLLSYGVIGGFSGPDDLPKLEKLNSRTDLNVHELRLQGYMVGNCAHCHSPAGFAMKENEVKLDLSPGRFFDFDRRWTTKDSIGQDNKKFFVHLTEGVVDFEQSYLYLRVKATHVGDGGQFQPMPMHTPGDANCRLVNLMGRWMRTLEGDQSVEARAKALAAADAYVEKCKPKDDFSWVDLDMTWPKSDVFVPRRADWRDPVNGMSQRFIDLRFPDELKALVRQKHPSGFWERIKDAAGNKVPKCDFPVALQPATLSPWMVNPRTNQMWQPYGEVYFTTPGAHYYTTTCSKCHGAKADGNSGFATNLLTLSGGSIRVANFMDGMFGKGGANLGEFDVQEPQGGMRNLGGNYLIWMAMEGTKVKFPEEAEKFLGRHKAQMLNQLRERCKNFIDTHPQKASPRVQDYPLFRDVCFFNNGTPADALLQFNPETDEPIDSGALEAWADRAAINVGWALFDYLKEEGAQGRLMPARTECEKMFQPLTRVGP